ncbi:MAG: hypothetical protein ABI600_13560 [Luteolibacter sp.]
MKTPLTLLCVLIGAVSALAIEEKPVTPVLESVGLFKNGLAVVRATFPVSGPGLYRWDKVPRVVHGSFWIESDGQVSVQSTTRLLESTDATESPSGLLQKDLAGKEVTLTLKTTAGTQPADLTGTVWAVPARTDSKTWDADYSSLTNGGNPYYGYRMRMDATPPPPPTTGNFLVLTNAAGARWHVDLSSISAVAVKGPFGPTHHSEERPVLVFDVRQAPANGGLVRVTYLTKGLAWLPAYQVDLSDSKSLKIRQSAVVRNEMDDLNDSEIQLISGYPNVRFGSVDSPLWPGTGLAAFFQQINQSGSPANSMLGNIASQQMVYSNGGTSRTGASPLPDSAEQGNISDDIHYESIGKRSLKAGDSLSLDIAAASAPYERVVEWVVPDPRDTNGRYQRNNNNGNEQARDDLPWDAVRFSNPFRFPMTTASAVVMEGGKFRGQSLSEWVNPAQSTCLRITRALSIHTESSEVEAEGQRELVWIGGNDYQRTKVTGRLLVRNFRNKEVTVTVRCEFSGELVAADENPEKTLRPEGVYSVNPRRQLEWNIKLPAGQEKALTYQYSVLVDR